MVRIHNSRLQCLSGYDCRTVPVFNTVAGSKVKFLFQDINALCITLSAILRINKAYILICSSLLFPLVQIESFSFCHIASNSLSDKLLHYLFVHLPNICPVEKRPFQPCNFDIHHCTGDEINLIPTEEL